MPTSSFDTTVVITKETAQSLIDILENDNVPQVDLKDYSVDLIDILNNEKSRALFNKHCAKVLSEELHKSDKNFDILLEPKKDNN